MNTQTVELHQAFMWICEDCGRDNFERATPIHPDSKDGREFMRKIRAQGITTSGEMLAAPLVVQCGHCRKRFKAIS